MRPFARSVFALPFSLLIGVSSPAFAADAPTVTKPSSTPALPAEPTHDMTTHKQRYAYTMGWQVAAQLTRQGVDFDPDAFANAIRDALAGEQPKLSDQEMRTAVNEQIALEKAEEEKLAKAAQTFSQAFFDAERAKPGVKELSDGILYEELKAGTGQSPTDGQTVDVHYHGTKIDGTVFDSSVERGQSVQFPVNAVIPGFSKALKAMQEGAKWRVIIPSDQGYGASGAGEKIGPHETLIFELELIKVLG